MRAIVTVTGPDRVGIIAAVCGLLARLGVNVLDVSQTIMDVYFTMTMLVDLSQANKPFDTIRDALAAGGDFASALRTREFEPDGPNWTPRISGTVRVCGGGMFTKMSILKAGDAEGTFCNRYTYEYPDCPAGMGRFIHTYQGDGDPLPSFSGEPEALAIEGAPDELAKSVWNALNEENKVSLFVQFIDLASGKADTRIINKNV